MKTDYEKQGLDFLMKHKIQMKNTFVGHIKHFEDDKESRDVFRVTFFRPGERFSIRFGQSISLSTGFGTHQPRPYDVITCLTKNDPETFEDFCSNFGYDTDSRKALKTYRAVCKEWEKVSAFFTTQELEKMQDIN